MKQVHIVHVVYSFATGGLENGMVNIINHLPNDRYRHSIICLTNHDQAFLQRIVRDNVDIYDLNKPAGKGISWLWRCYRLLRQLKPDICHTRNLNAMEAQVAAFLARVPLRIHGEHGWDVNDLGGSNVKYQKLRKVLKHFVDQFIGLSLEAIHYLTDKIAINKKNVTHICNGVDVNKFQPATVTIDLPTAFQEKHLLVFGTVGRLAAVKNQTLLVKSFLALLDNFPEQRDKLRLLIVGDGILMAELSGLIEQANAQDVVWLAGQRSDIAQLMNVMDVFVLPSLAEGISNTLLEAMACGLPFIATDVGGNADLVLPAHKASHIVSTNNIEALTQAMQQYVIQPDKVTVDSQLVREHCLSHFSIETMVNKYHQLYQLANK